jgi:hypothetical protein
MNTDDLFSIIGKLYTDLYNTQKIIEILQSQIKEKDREILDLKKPKNERE